MAKKRKREDQAPGGTPSPRHPLALSIRGSAAWRDWVRRGAAFCRTDTSKLTDAALTQYLKERGFDEPPPPR